MAVSSDMCDADDVIVVEDIEQPFISRVLRPYFPSCRYVRSANLRGPRRMPSAARNTWSTLTAELSISGSSYIESTGHFNAAEFVICLNQMGYIMIARMAELGAYGAAAQASDFGWFEQRQLSGVLLLAVDSRFDHMINPKQFTGEMTLRGAKHKRSLMLQDYDVRFWDEQGGKARGTVRAGLLL